MGMVMGNDQYALPQEQWGLEQMLQKNTTDKKRNRKDHCHSHRETNPMEKANFTYITHEHVAEL